MTKIKYPEWDRLEDLQDSAWFSAYCLLSPEKILFCIDLKLTPEEIHSAIYTDYVIRDPKTQKRILSLEKVLKRLVIKIMKRVKNGKTIHKKSN